MKQLLLFIFTRLLLSITSKRSSRWRFALPPPFCRLSGCAHRCRGGDQRRRRFYGIYHRVASSRPSEDLQDDSHVEAHNRDVLEQFRAFLRSLMMHAGVGTALGGVMTMVGEPQNLIIAKAAEWHFGEFFLRMAPVSVPVLVCGLATCILVENSGCSATAHSYLNRSAKNCINLTSRAANSVRAGDAASDCAGDHRRLAYRRAGVASCRSRVDWPLRHYSCHHL